MTCLGMVFFMFGGFVEPLGLGGCGHAFRGCVPGHTCVRLLSVTPTSR